MEKRILVVGGTGRLGQPVARQLKEDGYQVRVMARDVEKARKLFDESFEIVQGDVTDHDSLERALDGCHGVHISLNESMEQIGGGNVSAAAAKQGLERITYISGSPLTEEYKSYSFVRGKLAAEKAIRESGVPYTIFRPTWFMETLPELVQGGRATLLGKQPNKFRWAAAEDYARMVSTAYSLEEAANKCLVVNGPEAMDMGEALKRYCKAFHPEIKKVSSMPMWPIKIVAALLRNDELKLALEYMAFSQEVDESADDPTEANQLLGAPTTTLDAWLEKRKARLGAATSLFAAEHARDLQEAA
jgi:uncharacterized protein YbjT (DUF2867 family)